MNETDFISAEEAAKLLGIKVRTLYLNIREGKIKAQKVGKNFRINKNDIYHLLSYNKPKGLCVVKVGTQVLLEEGELDLNTIKRFASDLSELRALGWQVILVTSGAVGAGREVFEGKSSKDLIVHKQVLASIGQARLMHYYSTFFEQKGFKVAQVLLERSNFSDRKRFISIRSVIQELLLNGIIPIVNENDVVANKELRFGDNDELSALLSIMMDASTLIICSSISGLYTGDPTRNPEAKLIREVTQIDAKAFDHCDSTVSTQGMGGMLSKLQAVKLTTNAGIDTYIVQGKKKHNTVDVITGKEYLGTHFLPQKKGLKRFKKWLHAGALSFGKIMVDEGAAEAIMSHRSLLLVGVREVLGDFEQKDPVDVLNAKGETIATGTINYSSDELKKALKQKEKRHQKEVIHVDNILVL